MSMSYCVYKHASPSGKVYIGITGSRVARRWNSGNGYRQNKYFTSAIAKYGWDSFTHEVLESGLSADDARRREVELIAEYRSADRRFGYNQTTGGTLELRTDESKARMSEVKRKQMLDPEIRERVVASQEYRDKSFFKDEAYRAFRSECMKSQWQRPEFRRRMCEAHTGVQLVTSKAFAVVCVETGKAYATSAQAARETGATASNIRTCCKKEHYTAKGFHWRRIEQNA